MSKVHRERKLTYDAGLCFSGQVPLFLEAQFYVPKRVGKKAPRFT